MGSGVFARPIQLLVEGQGCFQIAITHLWIPHNHPRLGQIALYERLAFAALQCLYGDEGALVGLSGWAIVALQNVDGAQVIDGTALRQAITARGWGTMTYMLFEQRASGATEHFITLAEEGFFDADNPDNDPPLEFQRVIEGFVIQGGGRTDSRLGNYDDALHPELMHNREGVLSAAKQGDREQFDIVGDDTNDNQFFVTAGPTESLDLNHSVFGLLVERDDSCRLGDGAATGPDRRLDELANRSLPDDSRRPGHHNREHRNTMPL